MNTETMTFNELRAHYLAVKKRLGGLGKSAGLVPIEAIKKRPIELPVELIEEKIEEPKTFRVETVPMNNFGKLLIKIARENDVDPNFLVGSSRKAYLVKIRRKVVWQAVHDLKYPANRVAKWLKKDHTTILHDLYCYERDHGVGA